MNLKWFLFSFEGRIGRLPWWIYALVSALLSVFFDADSHRSPDDDLPLLGMLVLIVVAVVAAWSSIAVGVKRLHDIDKSGWWMLLVFVPIVGALALFVMNGFIAGTPHANRFGEPPSADEDEPAPRDPA
ncbi:DUF805 domain-containing protein [Burkholderia cepacia]|uniref:DUF805 domain-containing protein n=1 Tax=Burkholderia cepacia TaxID=292 RepID=UPI00075B4F6F|nr:DUF805 domain-containing protein [Burkholderia cepacia]OUE42160.1 DUF805 domain-containing protein [Burkholderia territorii]EMD9438743.1 DUF805 domain-containing protein [Burkholderia cepacia]KWH45770.1 hypothetical protein WM00_29760 [Burkholderia cepacia]RQT56696.1 DUF805 domain-containing protein [Burkholderia cepacia]HDR9499557.1 DUF805 domain-containing protein [Burkholderia cepacia]